MGAEYVEHMQHHWPVHITWGSNLAALKKLRTRLRVLTFGDLIEHISS